MRPLLLCTLVISQFAFSQTSQFSMAEDWQPYVSAPEEQRDSVTPWSFDRALSFGNLSPARFLSVDRLADKFPTFSPYVYAANNPLFFIDPSGDSINVASIQQYDNKNKTGYLNSMLGDLQNQTGLTLSVNATGQLVCAVDANGNPVIATDANGNQLGSEDARSLLVGGISAEAQAFATITSGYGSSVPAVGSPLIRFNPSQIEGQITGATGVNSATMGWGMTFMHEVLHSNVGGSLSDPRPATFGQTGDVVDRMNLIRSQLGPGYGQRLSYSAVSIGGNAYVPFSPIAKMMLGQGQVPVSYYVRFKSK